MTEQPTRVRLRIIIERPPTGIDYALQKGRGSTYETVQKQRSAGKDLTFEFEVGVKRGRGPSFIGPFVQGTAGDRFVYIDIGKYAGQENTECARRLKVPLAPITTQMVNTGHVLDAVIPGTGQDDTPTCAYAWRKQVGGSWRWTAVPSE
jgi:hypothetical protein